MKKFNAPTKENTKTYAEMTSKEKLEKIKDKGIIGTEFYDIKDVFEAHQDMLLLSISTTGIDKTSFNGFKGHCATRVVAKYYQYDDKKREYVFKDSFDKMVRATDEAINEFDRVVQWELDENKKHLKAGTNEYEDGYKPLVPYDVFEHAGIDRADYMANALPTDKFASELNAFLDELGIDYYNCAFIENGTHFAHHYLKKIDENLADRIADYNLAIDNPTLLKAYNSYLAKNDLPLMVSEGARFTLEECFKGIKNEDINIESTSSKVDAMFDCLCEIKKNITNDNDYMLDILRNCNLLKDNTTVKSNYKMKDIKEAIKQYTQRPFTATGDKALEKFKEIFGTVVTVEEISVNKNSNKDIEALNERITILEEQNKALMEQLSEQLKTFDIIKNQIIELNEKINTQTIKEQVMSRITSEPKVTEKPKHINKFANAVIKK